MNNLHFTRYWILLIFSLPILLIAKSKKPAILIYGSTIEAYVAALQSAASGVPTLWVNPASYSFEKDKFELKSSEEGKLIDGGVVNQFLKEERSKKDSTNSFILNGKRQSYNVLTADNLFLTILNGEDVVKIEHSKSWKVTLSNKSNYAVQVVMDASIGHTLASKAKVENLPQAQFMRANALTIADARSIVLVGEKQGEVVVSRLGDLISQKDNFFVVCANDFIERDNLNFRLAYGQVMGAIAGYCAFFKTTTDKIDLRTLQNELLMFRSRLLPTVDVSYQDKNFMSLQRMYLAGILPLSTSEGKPAFDLADSVRVSDIKPFVNQFYSRAQLWFVDNNPEYLTVQDALNLIKFTAFRAEELDVEVKNKWNKELTFKGEYDPLKVISRYEFAVLFDKYAAPFVKKVSQDGATIYR